MKYDVVIIGSGFGGLCCAHQLSKAGKRVLVLERQVQPGGCIQSYQRHHVSLDTGLHYVGGLDEGQTMHKIFTNLGLMKLPWQRLDPTGFDRITIGQQTFAFAEGFDQFVSTLSEHFPKEQEALQQYVKMLQAVNSVMFDDDRAFNDYGINAYNYLCDIFKDPLLINVLAGSALKLELRKETLPLFTFAHINSSYIQSSWRLKGDGNVMVQSLVSDIKAFGGDLICQAEAIELVETEGQISAVRCSNGETYEGDVFISDIHPAQTFTLVKESKMLRRLFRHRINMVENTTGIFTASLILKPGSLPYFNHNKFVYRKPNVWTFQTESDTVDGMMISCRIPETEGAAPQIDLLTPMSWELCKPWINTHVGHRGEDYLKLKSQMADECISLAETVIPGLSGMVTQRYTSTPLTYRDYTLTPDGSAYGMRKDSRNLMLTMLSTRTPIPNLLLTGQNLILHGLEGVAMTALQTCSDVIGKEYLQQVFK